MLRTPHISPIKITCEKNFILDCFFIDSPPGFCPSNILCSDFLFLCQSRFPSSLLQSSVRSSKGTSSCWTPGLQAGVGIHHCFVDSKYRASILQPLVCVVPIVNVWE